MITQTGSGAPPPVAAKPAPAVAAPVVVKPPAAKPEIDPAKAAVIDPSKKSGDAP